MPRTRRLRAALAGLLLFLSACGRMPTPRPDGPNVLLITVDTLRADHLGCYGYPGARTPRIDRLAAEGVRATDVTATAPITLPAHSSIMTGLYPPAHGVRDNGAYALADEATTLAEVFADGGWATHAIVSAQVLGERYNLDQGFEAYDDELWAEDDPQMFMIRFRPAPKTADRAIAWLDGRDEAADERPFFAWVHFFDPHQPYTAPREEKALSPTPYDAEIAVVDRAIGRILDRLEAGGLLDDTLVVFTADHGESLGQHGEKTHALFVYDATVHIPLILRWPGRFSAGRVYDAPVRTIDLAPTILSAVGLPPLASIQGVDLLGPFAGKAEPPELSQYSESLLAQVGFGMAPLHAVRKDGFKWIRAPRPEVYDLEQDAAELKNLFEERPGVARRLDRELQEILEDSEARALPLTSNPMDRETEEMLQALGYLAAAEDRKAMGGMDPKDGILLHNMLERARHLARDEKYEESVAVLRQVLAETPGNVNARNTLALSLWRLGRNEEAKDEYLRSLAELPHQARVYNALGQIALREGDLDAAERHFHQSLEVNPGFVEAMSNLGLVAAAQREDDEARRWYDAALQADEGFPRGQRRLGDLHFENGRFREALAAYRRSLEKAPEDFAALVQVGNAHKRLREAAQAAEAYRTAAELRPDAWIPPYNLACLAALDGRVGEALDHLDRAIEAGFDRPGLLVSDADLDALRSSPRFQRALRELEES